MNSSDPMGSDDLGPVEGLLKNSTSPVEDVAKDKNDYTINVTTSSNSSNIFNLDLSLEEETLVLGKGKLF